MANNITILVRADTAANWEARDSLLRMREIGYDQTNRRFKVGDGVTTWKNLPYVKPDVINDLVSGGVDKALSAEQGKNLKKDITNINTTISKLEQTITQIVNDGKVKVVNELKSTNSGTDALSAAQGWVLNGKIPSVVDSLTSDSTTAALSAKQGKALKNLIDGLPGSSVATISVGTVTTGAAGSKAKVENVGTSSAAVLNFTIPRGSIGATGATGPQGPQGAKGADAVVLNTWSNNATAALSAAKGYELYNKIKNVSTLSTESWTFTLSTGSTVTKKVVLSS